MSKELRTVRLDYKFGLHARPAAKLVEVACHFKSELYIEKNKRRANARSVIELLTLAVQDGERLSIVAEGEDAASAVETIAKLFEHGFKEMFGRNL
ncbi:MAG: HPr family phosphocarrier protein [Planctomycetota bacterium]|nr:HPr family phosphocarrier protein [Planctomycetota bacterium]